MKNIIISAIIAIGFTLNARAAKLCTGVPIVWATGISVSPTSGTIDAGATATVTATVAPTNATTRSVIWSTSNGGVASVSGSGTNQATGTITGVAAGTATITAKTNPSATSDGVQKSATYTINVNNPCGGYSIWSTFSGICNDNYICNGCFGDYNWGPNQQNSTWEIIGCPAQSTKYGKSHCSLTVGVWPTKGNPSTSNGSNCWCQLCTNSGRGTCGAWVFFGTEILVSDCERQCANMCAGHAYSNHPGYIDRVPYRAALCGMP